MEREEQLWNLTLSELSLILMNKEGKNKNLVYKEFKRRTNGLEKGILDHDEWVIDTRGLDINKYLVSKEPSLQLLFETYFNYVSGSKPYAGDYSQVLFSEMFLCNEMFFYNKLFFSIYNNELFNLEKRIESNNNENKGQLIKYKVGLILNKENILKRIKESKLEHIKYNEAYLLLKDEANGQEYINERYFGGNNVPFISSFNPIEKIYSEFVPLKIIACDSLRLNKQRSILYSESKKGTNLDYSTEPMQKILKIK